MTDHSPISARLALAALSLVAAWSLARCFVGPGEVVPALAAVVVAEVTIIAAGILAPRHRAAPPLLALAGIVGVCLVPLWITVGGATTWGWPTFSTWHVVGADLDHAWGVFNALRAPVPELPGFSLVGAWAAGGAALLAGWAADGGDTPLWVVAPPSAIFFFTAALGTPQWRPEAIALEVVTLAWYATAARASRRAQTAVVATRIDERRRRGRVPGLGVVGPATAIILVASVLAAVVGPRLPGALSPPLVSLRASGGDGVGGAAGGAVIAPPAGQISVSTLVQVAQEEIYQPHLQFFTVRSKVSDYTVLTTLDAFDGDRWTPFAGFLGGQDLLLALPPVASRVGVTKADDGRSALFGEQITVDKLGGTDIPAGAVPVEASGVAHLVYDVTTDTLESNSSLRAGTTFDIVSSVPIASPTTAPATPGPLSASLEADLSLPGGIPSAIVRLAHSIVRGQTTDYGKAAAIEDFFLGGQFQYSLPAAGTGSSSTVSGGEGLQDLDTFLFQTRTGFCQQYASAFAVLARIDGIPARIAVGFVPGTQTSADTYTVTGTDVHAWPQVYLGGDFGWWSFEPTPGSSLPTRPFSGPGAGGRGGTSTPRGGHGHLQFAPPPHSVQGTGAPVAAPTIPAATPPAPHSSSVAWSTLLLVVLAVLLLVLAAAPVARVLRRRRARGGSARVVAAWRDAASALELVGLRQREGETFSELAARVARAGAFPPDVVDQLRILAGQTTVAAYARDAPPPDVVREAVLASRQVSGAAHRRAGGLRRIWAAVTPRGLLDTRHA